MTKKPECPECGTIFQGTKCACGFSPRAKIIPFRAQCYTLGCHRPAEDRHGETEWMCQKHTEDYIIKTQPHSLFAQLMKQVTYLSEQAKNAGMSNYEYYKSADPKGYAVAKKLLGQKMA